VRLRGGCGRLGWGRAAEREVHCLAFADIDVVNLRGINGEQRTSIGDFTEETGLNEIYSSPYSNMTNASRRRRRPVE
jgi:hypothetical protein